jgi:hypothetical protein
MANKKKPNGGKKTKPVKPPTSRRGKGKNKAKETLKTIIAPELQIAKKMKDKNWVKKVKEGFLKGITFGLYKP